MKRKSGKVKIGEKKSYNRNPKFGRLRPSFKEILFLLLAIFCVAYVILIFLN